MVCVGLASAATQAVVVKRNDGETARNTDQDKPDRQMPPFAIDVHSRELLELPIWNKLRRGQLHRITREDVVKLFEALKCDKNQKLMEQDLGVLGNIPDLNLTDRDIAHLVKDCDTDNSGQVGVDELYRALLQGSIAERIAIKTLQHPHKNATADMCKKDDLVEFLDNEYTIRDAFWSLPWAFAFFFTWTFLLHTHLVTDTAYSVQAALQAEVTGEGPPYLLKHVHDAPTFWDWMGTSFIGAHFKYNLQSFPFPGRVASFNQVIGGIQLERTNSNNEPCQQSPVLGMAYDTQGGGQCYRTANHHIDSEYLLYHMREEDMKDQLARLRNNEWLNQNTTVLNTLVLFYNAHNNVFTSYQLSFDMHDASGLIKILWNMETFCADPYYNWVNCIPDVIFILLLFKMLYIELKEMLRAMLAGIDGFSEYWSFLNIVDWLEITLGLLMISLWTTTVANTGLMRTIIDRLPTKVLDEVVIRNNTFLTSEQFEAITTRAEFTTAISDLHAAMSKAAVAHRNVRFWAYWYTFVLMIKFFKSFQANPQLNVVILTMTDVASDVAHFTIVFGTIFWVFATSGHIIFGRSIKGFRNSWESAMTCWSFLMGDYDTEPMRLAGGWLAWVWMVSFQFLVTSILLNMLLAIIMEQYLVVKGNLAGGATITKQVKDMLKTVRTERHFVNMWRLICALKEQGCPTHPRLMVTPASLVEAFRYLGMSWKNAHYLIDQTIQYNDSQTRETAFSLTDSMKHIGHVKSIVMKVAETSDRTHNLLQMRNSRPKVARFDSVSPDPDADTQEPPMPLTRSSPNSETFHDLGQPKNVSFGYAGHETKLMLKMEQLQATMEAMKAQVWEHQKVNETHSQWLEDRILALNNTCYQAQIASETVCDRLQGVELSSFMAIPSAIQLTKREAVGSANLGRNSTIDDNSVSKVEFQLQELNRTASQLISQADKQAEMRNMIQRIDCNLQSLQQASIPTMLSS